MRKKAIHIPPVLTCLGQTLEVSGRNEFYGFPIREKVALYTNPAGRVLFCFSPAVRSSSQSRFDEMIKKYRRQVNRARKLYTRWHDFEPVSGSLCPSPKGQLICIDRSIEIVYRSDKWSGALRDYYHPWETHPLVWVDKYERPTLLVLSGGNIRVTKEGIKG